MLVRAIPIVASAVCLLTATAFQPQRTIVLRVRALAACFAGPRPLHTEFTSVRASEEQLAELVVKNWPARSTAGSAKYQVGKTSAPKPHDCSELPYIIPGKMEIIPEAAGEPVLVKARDFVTFPGCFPCYWHVIEEADNTGRLTDFSLM